MTNDTDYLVIQTMYLTLRYKESYQYSEEQDSGFTPENLEINGTDPSPFSFHGTWTPGQANEGALPGAIKSLDALGVQTLNCTTIERENLTVHDESLHCNWALYSRSGWTLVDDTATPLIDPNDPDGWWQTDIPNANKNDWYFFAHGARYLDALKDYKSIGGSIPLLPKYVFGTWWTRWFNYNYNGIRSVVDNFRQYSLPLDVLVYDMNWHIKDGSPDGWTGYSWDKRVLPNHNQLNRWLKGQGLKLAANLHDNEGVGPNEDEYSAACAAIGLDPESKETIPFSVVNKTLMFAVEDEVLQPLKANGTGLDFWWIDWQQGGKKGGASGGRTNPTIWLNKVRSTDLKRKGSNERTLVLGRWGGLGAHRYPVGFSGDISDLKPNELTWGNLAYQPYFSASGSNVMYSWSHDILPSGRDSENALRWVQWGSMSSIMRFHDRGLSSGLCNDPFVHPGQVGSCKVDLIWKLPYKYFQAARGALQLRQALMPYLYNAAREAFDSGIPLIRPMYLYYPENDLAYANDMYGNFTEYFFGSDSMVVAPVVFPVDKETNLAKTKIWLPPGVWIEKNTGSVIEVTSESSGVIEHDWDITEIPTYIKGGAIIPATFDQSAENTIGTTLTAYKTLCFELYPPSGSYPSQGNSSAQTGLVYEDDSATTSYIDGDYTLTTVSTSEKSAAGMQITLQAPEKTFSWLPETREFAFVLVNSIPAKSVTMNGQDLPYDDLKTGTSPSYYYDASRVATVIFTGAMPIDKSIAIEIEWAEQSPANFSNLSGLKGILSRSNLALEALNEVQGSPGFFNAAQGSFERLTTLGVSIEEDVASGDFKSAFDALNSFDEKLAAAIQEVQDTKENDANRKAYALNLLSTAKI